ncbi:glucoamylase family protein [Lapillicoccus sp.]|uniref:glucoamylase family protein n=1 Tax=Lapillicoccus sp. TaxID=1909287 RepID=UPI0025DA977F|nr:glucoamylase family protein [Lapillicoccus sp.]
MTPTPAADCRRWARDTWRSLEAMTDRYTGLVADAVGADLGHPSPATSPTNIGDLLWSAVAARELGVIDADTCRDLLARAIATIGLIPSHEPSGLFYNWYDSASGEPVLEGRADGRRVRPLVSSVDTAWLATGLMVARAAEPSVAGAASRIVDRMRWDMVLDRTDRAAGLISAGFRDEDPGPGSPMRQGNQAGLGPDVWYLPGYDTIVSETRIASYLGIAAGQVPHAQWFGPYRTLPQARLEADRAAYVADEEAAGREPHLAPPPVVTGETVTHLGVDVVEGAVAYRGMRIVPGWGGSMFEELMPDLFVPEAEWGPRSWGRNHPLHVRAQREHGLEEEGLGVWGFSPSSDPPDGYGEFGVKALGMSAAGYWSRGTVTPHASFLAMAHEPEAALDNLGRVEVDHGAYGPGGFHDAVDVRRGLRAEHHLALDQAMVMAALANHGADDAMRRCFAPQVEAVRPLVEMEEFGAGA